MNFSELKGTSGVTFHNDESELLLRACPSMPSRKTTIHWQPENRGPVLTGASHHITPGPEPGRGAVPFSSLWQMVVSAGTRVLPSTWWVSRQTERAACPAWYRWQTRLQRTCSQWGQRETSSESGTRGGRPPPQRHLPWALALWHPRRLPYQLLSLPSYCFPQIPARHGPHGITGDLFRFQSAGEF